MERIYGDSPRTLRFKAIEFRRLAAQSVLDLHDLADECEKRAAAIERKDVVGVHVEPRQ